MAAQKKRKIIVQVEKHPYDWTTEGGQQTSLRRERAAMDVIGNVLIDLDQAGQRRVLNYVIDLLGKNVIQDRDMTAIQTRISVR